MPSDQLKFEIDKALANTTLARTLGNFCSTYPEGRLNSYKGVDFEYERNGVKEYWMIDPKKKNIIVYTFDENDDDNIAIYGFEDKVPVGIYDGKLTIDFAEISEYVDSVCGK